MSLDWQSRGVFFFGVSKSTPPLPFAHHFENAQRQPRISLLHELRAGQASIKSHRRQISQVIKVTLIYWDTGILLPC